MNCTYCQSELNPEVHFCKQCGHPVPVDSSLEDLFFSRLSSLAPPSFVRKVRSAPYLGKERRTVTAVMFTIANLETFAQAIPEKDRSSIINRALDHFAKIIFQYEGTIAKYWQHTLLAFFGAPISHEDDPLRAVHAADAIRKEVNNYSEELLAKYGIPVQLRMVINTGQIIIGDIKSNLKFDFQSLNNTLECLDTALKAKIPRCEVILFNETNNFVKPFIKSEKLQELFCPQRKRTLILWRLDQLLSEPNHFRRIKMIQNTTLIGREKELDQLLELSETVLAGLGRVGMIYGDPGIGKSRLILDWKSRMKSMDKLTPLRWIQANGLAFGRELAYHLMKNLIRSALEVPDTASKEKLRGNLKATLNNLNLIEEQNLYLYLAHLIEIPLSESEEVRIHSLNASELRAQYLQAIRTFFRHLAQKQPLMIILEDLHWADISSLELLSDLLPLTASSPILFCLVSRLERNTIGWDLITDALDKIGSRLTQIELHNLNKMESLSLIQELLEAEEIPEDIQEMVLEKSEGNPYFIEELIRMLINEGVLTQEDQKWILTSDIDPEKIPNSLQGLLIARIDRLPPEPRLTLRVASIIGRSFQEKVIKQVMADHAPDIEPMEQLSLLESMGLVKIAQVNPELTYKFQHILMQDAAYNSILDMDRKNLHLSVGKSLEILYPDQSERLASQLGHHFFEGGHSEKAYEYFDMAGHVSMEAFAITEAETYFHRALQLTKDPAQIAHLQTDIGQILSQGSKHREAVKVWKEAIDYYHQSNNTDRLARIYAWAARSAWWAYDPKRNLEIAQEGLKAVEGAVESPDIAYLIHETGRAYLFNNQPRKAQAYCEQALEMATRLDAFDVQAEALATIGILPTIKPQRAIAALEKAIDISESNNLYSSASRAYINLAAVMDKIGKMRQARDYRKKAIQLGSKSGNVAEQSLILQAIIQASLWLADFEEVESLIEKLQQINNQENGYLDENALNLLYYKGSLAHYKGNFTDAIEIFTELNDRSRQSNDLANMIQANRSLVEVTIESYLLENKEGGQFNLDIVTRMMNDVLKFVPNQSDYEDISTQCLLSDLNALQGNLKEAQKALDLARRLYHQRPTFPDRFRLNISAARLATAHNNLNKAIEAYLASLNLIEKMEGKWLRARTMVELGDAHLKRNEPEDIDQAQNIFREALAAFRDIGVNYYPDVIIEKLRHVKQISRAQAIAHSKVTREMAEAGRIQHTFMPTHSPEITGYQISGTLLPARETSGDFYDFIELSDEKLGIVIADVGDKGAGAALYMAMSRTLIRTYAGEGERSPGEIIAEVNRRILSDTQRGIFLTAFYGVLDPQKHTFTYINAGHNPPVVLLPKEDATDISFLNKTGSLVGLFEDSTWETKTIEIQPGAQIVLYTDGIPEAQNDAGEFYGNERLITVLRDGINASAKSFQENILKDVKIFLNSAPRLDDITLIVVARNK